MTEYGWQNHGKKWRVASGGAARRRSKLADRR